MGEFALRSERVAAAGAAEHELLRNFLLRQIDEVLPAAVHWHDMRDVKLLKLGHHHGQVVGRCRREMEPADQCIDLLDAADLLGAPERVDDAAVTAGTQHDKPAIAHFEVACSCQCWSGTGLPATSSGAK